MGLLKRPADAHEKHSYRYLEFAFRTLGFAVESKREKDAGSRLSILLNDADTLRIYFYPSAHLIHDVSGRQARSKMTVSVTEDIMDDPERRNVKERREFLGHYHIANFPHVFIKNNAAEIQAIAEMAGIDPQTFVRALEQIPREGVTVYRNQAMVPLEEPEGMPTISP